MRNPSTSRRKEEGEGFMTQDEERDPFRHDRATKLATSFPFLFTQRKPQSAKDGYELAEQLPGVLKPRLTGEGAGIFFAIPLTSKPLESLTIIPIAAYLYFGDQLASTFILRISFLGARHCKEWDAAS
ncbi:hypothetical protein SESBI_03711 [Sesbania bispinosa]|nr:hypothetical protein SESBI_03711 [Sesbania bispinosa]